MAFKAVFVLKKYSGNLILENVRRSGKDVPVDIPMHSCLFLSLVVACKKKHIPSGVKQMRMCESTRSQKRTVLLCGCFEAELLVHNKSVERF